MAPWRQNQRRAGVVALGIIDFGTANMSLHSNINSEEVKEDVI